MEDRSNNSKVLNSLQMAALMSKMDREAESEKRAKENVENRSDLYRGWLRGVDSMQATYQGTVGLGQSLIGDELEASRRFRKYQDEMQQASENPATVQNFFSADPKSGAFGSVGNMGRWAAGALGSAAPSLVESAVTGAAGAAAGSMLVPGPDPGDVVTAPIGAIAGMFSKAAVKKAIGEVAEQYIKKGIAKEAAEQMAEQSVRNTIAKKVGAGVATSQVTAAHESGGMWAEGKSKGVDNPLSALALGQVSGISEAVLGAVPAGVRMAIGRRGIADVARKSGPRVAAGMLWDLARNGTEEGLQESFQEFLGSINESINDPKAKILTKENFMKWAEAGAQGALVGGLFGVGEASQNAYRNFNQGEPPATPPDDGSPVAPQAASQMPPLPTVQPSPPPLPAGAPPTPIQPPAPPQAPPAAPVQPTASPAVEPPVAIPGGPPLTQKQIEAIAALGTRPSMHKWADIVLNDRDKYAQAPKDETERIRLWEQSKAYIAAQQAQGGTVPPIPGQVPVTSEGVDNGIRQQGEPQVEQGVQQGQQGQVAGQQANGQIDEEGVQQKEKLKRSFAEELARSRAARQQTQPPADESSVGQAPSEGSVGERTRIMDTPVTRSNAFTDANNIRYELFEAEDGKSGVVRSMDVDSGSVVYAKKFPSISAAKNAFKQEQKRQPAQPSPSAQTTAEQQSDKVPSEPKAAAKEWKRDERVFVQGHTTSSGAKIPNGVGEIFKVNADSVVVKLDGETGYRSVPKDKLQLPDAKFSVGEVVGLPWSGEGEGKVVSVLPDGRYELSVVGRSLVQPADRMVKLPKIESAPESQEAAPSVPKDILTPSDESSAAEAGDVFMDYANAWNEDSSKRRGTKAKPLTENALGNLRSTVDSIADEAVQKGRAVKFASQNSSLDELQMRAVQDAVKAKGYEVGDIERSKEDGTSFIGFEVKTSKPVKQEPAGESESAVDYHKKNPELAPLYEADAGVKEGYTIEQHTRAVLDNWNKEVDKSDIDEIARNTGAKVGELMQDVIALHDIGKPNAIKKGKKSLQHAETLPILKKELERKGYSDKEVRIGMALVSNDVIGKLIQAKQPDAVKAAQELDKLSKEAGISLQDFFRLQTKMYKADAGSYPALRESVFKLGENGKLTLPDVNFGILEEIVYGKVLEAPWSERTGEKGKGLSGSRADREGAGARFVHGSAVQFSEYSEEKDSGKNRLGKGLYLVHAEDADVASHYATRAVKRVLASTGFTPKGISKLFSMTVPELRKASVGFRAKSDAASDAYEKQRYAVAAEVLDEVAAGRIAKHVVPVFFNPSNTLDMGAEKSGGRELSSKELDAWVRGFPKGTQSAIRRVVGTDRRALRVYDKLANHLKSKDEVNNALRNAGYDSLQFIHDVGGYKRPYSVVVSIVPSSAEIGEPTSAVSKKDVGKKPEAPEKTVLSDEELKKRILEAMLGESAATDAKAQEKPPAKVSAAESKKGTIKREQKPAESVIANAKKEAVNDYEAAKQRFRDAFNKAKGTSLSNAPLTPEYIELLSAVADMMVQGIRVKAWSLAEIVADLADTFGRENIPAMREYLQKGWDAAVKLEGAKPADYDKVFSEFATPVEPKKVAVSEAKAAESSAGKDEESEADKTLRQAGLIVEQLPDGSWQITGNTYENSKEIGDVKREIRELGGAWDSRKKRWTFKLDPRREIADRIAVRRASEQSVDAGSRDEQVAREEARRAEDGRPDVRRASGDYASSVDKATKDLISRGLKFGMTQEVVDSQIEDIGRVVVAAESNLPMFVIGSAPGTGKTFVLGGVIRELRSRGFDKFVYVTQNQNLISQVQNNLADYGLEGVEFTTYSKSRETPLDTTGAVLLLDEAHSAKNTDRNTGKSISNMVSRSRFAVYATATPFENVTEAEYIGYSGIFDDIKVEFDRPSNKPGKPFRNKLEGFPAWAWMFGAKVYFIKQSNRDGSSYLVPVVSWEKHQTAEADQFAANEWLKKRGVYVQRSMSLPAGTVNSDMRGVDADPYWADVSNEVVQIYADAEVEAENEVERGQIKAHKVNVLKRLLEASKVDAAIARAKELVGDGKQEDSQVILFVNTKKELNLGSFTLSEPYRKHHNIKGSGKTKRYKPKEMDEMMQRWYEAKRAAQAMGEGASSVGPPPFAPFIHKIAMAMDRAGVMKKFPSVIDSIMNAFPGQAVEFSGRMTDAKNADNLAKWKSNEAKVIVATMDKGGTGLSFHDTTGKMPSRYQINMNLPWSGTKVEQVSGRLARYGTAKPVNIEWIFANNIPFDRELSMTVGSRMRSMSAAVQGRNSGDAKRIRDFDFEESQIVEGNERALTPVSEIGIKGRATVVNTKDDGVLDAVYYVVEAEYAIPSHDPRKNYSKNPRSWLENERVYHDPKQAADSRKTVYDVSEAMPEKLNLLTADVTSPSDGPPMTDKFGVVLGGNGRAMGMQWAYEKEGANRLREHILSEVEKFGISRKQAEKLKNPIVIRVIVSPFNPLTISASLNEGLSASKTAATASVSQAKRISSDTIDIIAKIMASDDNPSLRDVMGNPRHADRIVRALVRDGAWSTRDADSYINPVTSDLNEDGKSAIEQMLVAKVIPDPTLLGDVSATVRQKVLFAISPLARGMASETYGKELLAAMLDAAKAYDGYAKERKLGATLQDYFMGQEQFVPVPGYRDYSVAGLVHAMNVLTPTAFKNAMNEIITSLGIGERTVALFDDMNQSYSSLEDAIRGVINPPLRKFGDKLAEGVSNPPDTLYQLGDDVDPQISKKALSLAIAADEAGIDVFNDFVAYSVREVGEKQTRLMGEYLEIAGEAAGMRGVRSVSDILGRKGVTKEQFVELAKKAMPSLSGKMDTLAKIVDITAFGLDEIGFDPFGSPVPRQSVMQRGEQQTSLSVLHNLSSDNLIFSDKMGGLAVPSLAIVKGDMSLEAYGDITLIGKKDLADPKKAEVYDADAYTTRFPRPEYKKVKMSVAQKFADKFKPWASKFDEMSVYYEAWDNAVNRANAEDTVFRFLNSNAAKSWFLSEKGQQVEPVMTPVPPRWDWTHSDAWVDFVNTADHSADKLGWGDPARVKYYKEAGDAVVRAMRETWGKYSQVAMSQEEVDEIIQSGMDNFLDDDGGILVGYLDPAISSAKTRGDVRVDKYETEKKLDSLLAGMESEFKSWVEDLVLPMYGAPFLKIGRSKVDYTLENIVEYMTREGTHAKERTMSFGEGMARAVAAQRITSFEEMRNRAGSIAGTAEINAAREASKKALEGWRDRVIKYHEDGTWEALDSSMRAIAKWAKGKELGAALRSEGFRSVPKDIVEQGVEAGRLFMQAPVPYFEAKPHRVVRLDEFAGAVIPEDADLEVKSILAKHGIPFTTYSSRYDEAERRKAVLSLRSELEGKGENVLFQKGEQIPLSIAKSLTPEELKGLRVDTVRKVVEHFKSFPPQSEFEEAAKAGVAKRGWYRRAAESLQNLFGEDTPTFVRLLAATSPRQGVTENLTMTLRIWNAWNEAGRPQSVRGIKEILRPIPGAMFGSRVKNTVRALRGETDLRGYKVNSFARNLLGDMEAVTNDAWMASFAGIDPKLFGTKAAYLAFSAKVRKTAKKLGMSPAEVQESIWSFAKTMSALRTGGRTSKEALAGMTHESVASMPEFANLILENKNVRRQLERLGLGGALSEIARKQTAIQGEVSGRIETDRPDVLGRVARRIPAGAGGRGAPDAVAKSGVVKKQEALVASSVTDEEYQNLPTRVTPEEEQRLNSEKTVTLYRAMSLIDGKLYPPMSAKMSDAAGRLSLRPAEPVGRWTRSQEKPEMVPKKGKNAGKFPLKKPGGGTTWALYAPYFHASPIPLNDQFSAAWLNDGVQRPRIVTVEVEVPESELSSGYQADGSVKKTGVNKWNSGVVASKVPGGRDVILSRYIRIKRIVPESEVAQKIAELVNPNRIAIPENTVTPQLRAELEKNGVSIAPAGTSGSDLLYQKPTPLGGVKGWTKFVTATRAIIGATDQADVSTFIHEFFHPMRRFLLDRSIPQSQRAGITDEEIKALEKYAGVKNGKWTVDAEEKAAKAWEQYWFEGKAPNSTLSSLFKKIAKWMRGVYKGIEEITGGPLPDDVRKLFDKLVQRGMTADKSSAAKKDSVSIKNAVVNERRARRGIKGLEDVAAQTQQEWLDAAESMLTKDPMLGDRLVKEINKKARNLSNIEVAVMQLYYRKVNNQLAEAADKLFAAKDQKDALASARAMSDTDIIMNVLVEIEEATKKAGREWGRAGVARQIELDKDYSLIGLMRRARLANAGNALNEEQLAEVRELAARVAELEGDLAKANQDKLDLERRKNVQDQIEDSKKQAGEVKVRDTVRRKAVASLNAFKNKFSSVFGLNKASNAETLYATQDEQMVEEAKSVVQAFVEMGVFSFGEFMANVRKELNANLPVSANVAFAKAWQEIKDQGGIPSPAVSQGDVRGLSRLAKQVERSLVISGITDLDEVVRGVHESLQEVFPDITERETMDAMSGYGQYSPPSDDENDKVIADINARLLQLAKLEDMRAGIAPARTGIGRQEPSPELRELIRQVNLEKREGKYRVTDAKNQLKSAVGAAKTALRNRIYDLDKAVNITKKPIPGQEKRDLAGKDAELDALRKQRDELMAQYKALFPKPAATMDERIAATSRALDRVIADLEEQLQTGEFASRQKGEPISTPELDAKRARVQALRAQRDAIVGVKKRTKEQIEKAYKANLLKQIADYKERMAKSEFDPKPKKEIRALSKDELRLKMELAEVKDEFFRMAAGYRLANMSPRERAWDYFKETMHLSRALMTSLDASAVFRQGGAVAFSHPVMGAAVARDMYKAMMSKESGFNTAEQIRKDKDYQFAVTAGLQITEEEGNIVRQEEAFMGRWARDGLGKQGSALNKFSKFALWPVASSARGYMTFLNGIRFQLFKHFIATVGRGGQVTADEAKVIAMYINAATGRSDLGPMLRWAEQMNMLFFAPRFVASRFQYLGLPLWLLGSRKVSGRVKKAIAMEYVRHATGVMSFLGLTVALGRLLSDDEEEKPTVSLDPRSSDFLKIKIGETRIDPMSGLSQVIVLASRIATGKRVRADGEVVSLRGDDKEHATSGVFGVMADFLRSKLAPIPGAIVDIPAEENVVGQTVTPASAAVNLVLPLSLREISETAESRGIPQGVLITLLSLHGMGASTYGPESNYRKANALQRQKQFAKDLKRIEFDSPDPAYKGMLTKEQMAQVRQRREEKKQGLVYAATSSPDRKTAKSVESYNQSLAEQKAALESLKSSGVTLIEARQLLIKHWEDKYGSAKEMRGGVSVYKPALSDRLQQLRKAFSR